MTNLPTIAPAEAPGLANPETVWLLWDRNHRRQFMQRTKARGACTAFESGMSAWLFCGTRSALIYGRSNLRYLEIEGYDYALKHYPDMRRRLRHAPSVREAVEFLRQTDAPSPS